MSSAERAAEALASEDRRTLDAYEAAGFRLIPLKEDKKPRGNGWPGRTITREEIERNFVRGGGVGIQAGECSGWICAADLDCGEARELAPLFLPKTLTSGKEGERLPSHYVYVSEGAGYKQFNDVDMKRIVDLKASSDGAGHQFVVAPSVHATKGPYKWAGGFNPSEITRISSEDLERRLGRLAAATLIARHFPPPGGRHDYRMMVAGFLLRNGETIESAREVMRPALEIAGANRDGLRDLDEVLEDTAKDLEQGKRVKGGGELHKSVPYLPSRIGDALGWERPDTSDGQSEYAHTDDGNALRFVDRYGDLIRYCPPWRAWLVWDGQRWVKGADGAILRMARAVARNIHADAADTADTDEQKRIGKWAIQSQHASRIQAMISLARADERVEVQPDVFDADPWVLCVENGTLDLRTGKLRPHNPADHITRLAPVPYDPHALAPRFEQFLSEVFAEDADLVAFLQRFAGYTLSGSTEERCLAILYGAGKNGKSTLMELMRHVLGDYAQSTDVETILAKRYAGVGNDVAALKGARFVSTSEIDKGRRLAESKVKQLTGSDTVTARFLFSEPFDFRPEFKLWISTNNKPEIKGTDNAIWDRIRLVPFGVRFEGDSLDKDLPQKLRDEAPGVLAWLVRGCLEWRQDGLGSATSIDEATQDYRVEMDILAAFIDEGCLEGPEREATAAHLYSAYKTWCEDNHEEPEKQRRFGEALRARGYESFTYTTVMHKGRKGWRGVMVK